MKKLCSALLTLAMALSLTTAALAAETTLTVNVPDTLPKAGEKFTVTVDISGNPGLCSVQLTLAFDKSVVKCTEVTLGKVLSGALSATNENASGGAKIACAAIDAKTGDGVLSTYTFKVLKGGDPAFELIDGVFVNAEDKKITPAIRVNGVEADLGQTTETTHEQQAQQGTTQTTTTPTQPTDEAAGETAVLFSDTASHWGADYIEKAVALGLFTGYPDGTFRPDDTISRADFVTVLWRSAGSPEPKAGVPFADVAANAYYARAVAWAKENGYVDGVSAAAFDPAGVLQRQAAMKILYYCNGGVSGLESLLTAQYDASFADSGEIASWAKTAMYWAYFNGIISGTGGDCLSPAKSATRAEMAKILVNYLESN